MITAQEAKKLVKYCTEGQWKKAQEELYSDHAVSIEPAGSMLTEVASGMKAIGKKGEQWQSMIEKFYGMKVDGPLVADKHFTVTMTTDVKMKGMPRSKNSEVCVFRVEDGKIVSEQFFYPVS